MLAEIPVLSGIYNAIVNLGTYVLIAIVTGINAVIVALGAAIVAVLALLPSLPDAPDPPDGVEWMNWFFPIGGVIGVLSGLVTAYVVFLGLRILLRWVKAA